MMYASYKYKTLKETKWRDVMMTSNGNMWFRLTWTLVTELNAFPASRCRVFSIIHICSRAQQSDRVVHTSLSLPWGFCIDNFASGFFIFFSQYVLFTSLCFANRGTDHTVTRLIIDFILFVLKYCIRLFLYFKMRISLLIAGVFWRGHWFSSLNLGEYLYFIWVFTLRGVTVAVYVRKLLI